MSRALALLALCAAACAALLPRASATGQVVVTLPETFPPKFQDPTTTWHVNERILFQPGAYRGFKRAEAYLNATGKYPIVYGYGPIGNATQQVLNATKSLRGNLTMTVVNATATLANATAAATNFTGPLAGAGSDLAQAISNALKTTGTTYNLTIGKYVNATVYKVAVLPPRKTVGVVNVTDKISAAVNNVTSSLGFLGRKMLSHELAA